MSHYWRHLAVPHIEIRNVEDGRTFAHGSHSHATFSIGAIMAGQSSYLNGHSTRHISAGSVVLMNPGVVHACNPLHDQPWAYRMFYVDAGWLASVQRNGGIGAQDDFIPFAENCSTDSTLFAELDSLYVALTENGTPPDIMQAAVLKFFQRLVTRLQTAKDHTACAPHKMTRAADFIREHCIHALRLEDIAAAVQLSPSYLIRTFKAHYGLTPHGYLIDCRLQLARDGLRRGDGIAEVAAQAGFADQAHLQRLFKRSLAATPGQYRGLITPATNTQRSPPAMRPCPG
jgi:AraC-like DNA-binding protein